MEIARIVARCLWEENRLLQTAATAAQVRGGHLEQFVLLSPSISRKGVVNQLNVKFKKSGSETLH